MKGKLLPTTLAILLIATIIVGGCGPTKAKPTIASQAAATTTATQPSPTPTATATATETLAPTATLVPPPADTPVAPTRTVEEILETGVQSPEEISRLPSHQVVIPEVSPTVWEPQQTAEALAVSYTAVARISAKDPTATPTARRATATSRPATSTPTTTVATVPRPTSTPTPILETIVWNRYEMPLDDAFKDHLRAGPVWGSTHFECNHPIWGFPKEVDEVHSRFLGGSEWIIFPSKSLIGTEIYISYKTTEYPINASQIWGSLSGLGSGKYLILDDPNRGPWIIIRDQVADLVKITIRGAVYEFWLSSTSRVVIYCANDRCQQPGSCPRTAQ